MNQDCRMLQEITNIFIRIVISCIHIRKHQLIYIQSIKELKEFVPEVVDVEINITVAQYEKTLTFLSTKLARDLKPICKKKAIDFDASKWFDNLFKNAQMFLESFTKIMLIALLKKLMQHHTDLYLSIPYLKSLYLYIKRAVDRFQELSRSRSNTSSKYSTFVSVKYNDLCLLPLTIQHWEVSYILTDISSITDLISKIPQNLSLASIVHCQISTCWYVK